MESHSDGDSDATQNTQDGIHLFPGTDPYHAPPIREELIEFAERRRVHFGASIKWNQNNWLVGLCHRNNRICQGPQ
ncbi:hypothetical protein HMPREF0724_10680 [Prescottella equi ATCC 33707]|uniref:Uncharacterized protein n=1 Tax=Prescottella equi ATCC 33707 TaxID=525370 RepID=E9SX29_RHOHA|nr:hypothetical protein HMPREF0724_10680 [Prescottella equi ATCC 33707]